MAASFIEEQLQRAVQVHNAGDVGQAEVLYREIVNAYPRFAAAWEHLGQLQETAGKLNEAVEYYQRVLSIDANHASAFNNLANAYAKLGNYQESLACYDRALAIDPAFVTAHVNKAIRLVILGQVSEGLRHIEEALRHDPENAHLHKSVGVARLMLGDFAGGWPDFEWRYRAAEPALPAIDRPLWDGAALYGKTILLICEPGLGDDVQFIRYGAWLKERYKCRTLFAGRPRLRELLSTCEGIDEWVDEPPPNPLPHFDVFAPLMRIPAVLGHTLRDAPMRARYLTANASLTRQWKNRLANYEGLKIGIHWRVGHQQGIAALRNVPLKELASLRELAHVQLFSLQKGPEAETVRNFPEIVDLGRKLDEDTGAFVETAAVLMNLDLLITCDSAIAHVAGAIGTPVWLALHSPCDWRWSQSGETTVWYPSMRLFRQGAPGDWSSVMKAITAAIRQMQARGT